MSYCPPKKLLILYILEILRRYSSQKHPLKQKDIINYLRDIYGMPADRKSVRRNLQDLSVAGYPIEYTEKTRINADGEEETICTDWFIRRNFSDAQLRLLIDGILFSKSIPYDDCKDLIEKIKTLSDGSFKERVKHICNIPSNQLCNEKLFDTIDIIDNAIEKKLQIKFCYADYNIKKQPEPRVDTNGKPVFYIVNPYQMVAANGRYYLIANINKYNDVSHFRVDKIMNVCILSTHSKPKEKVDGLGKTFNLPRHMAEHIYMFSGESSRVVMKAPRSMVSELVDWFGNDISFSDITNETITARVTVNLKAMRYWALQYSPNVTIISPASLAEQIKEDLKTALSNYNNKEK